MVLTLALFACKLLNPPDEEQDWSDPFAPRRAAWTADQPIVAVGDVASFTAEIVWDRPIPDDLVVRHTYEGYVTGFTFTWEGRETLRATYTTPASGPEAGREVLIEGSIEVCATGPYIDCESLRMEPATVLPMGGQTTAVMFPVDEVVLAVGESRVVQGTAIGWRPALGGPIENANDTVHTQAPIAYTSLGPNVFSVDADGVITGIAPGDAVLQAVAGDRTANLPIRVTEAVPGPLPEGVYPLTTRFWGGPLNSDTGRDDRSWDALSFVPGGLLALNLAQIAEIEGDTHITERNPAYLTWWTGTGFAQERLTDWREAPREVFVEGALDGHVFVGWASEDRDGITLIDRPAEVAVGGWQRRHLDASPDPLDPRPPKVYGWNPDSDPQITALPFEDGVFVAYSWAEVTPDPLPDWPTRCVASLRLAIVTPDAVIYEDVARQFLEITPTGNESEDLGACREYLEWHENPWPNLRLAAPPPGTDRPLVILDWLDGPSVYARGLGGWAEFPFEDLAAFLGDDALVWSPGFPLGEAPIEVSHTQPLFASAPDGTAWFVDAAGIGNRVTPFGSFYVQDHLLGPHFGDRDDAPESGTWEAVASGYGQFALISTITPPNAPPHEIGDPYPTWLYVTDLDAPIARPDAEFTEGRAIGARVGGDLVALDGGAIVAWRGAQIHEVPAFETRNVLMPMSAEPPEDWPQNGVAGTDALFWGDGDRLMRANGALISASTDGGRTFTDLGTIPGTTYEIVAGATAHDGSHLLCSGNISSRVGPFVHRVIESEGGVQFETLELPAFTAGSPGTGPEYCALWPDGDATWILRAGTWQGPWSLSVTRWRGPDDHETHTAELLGQPALRAAARAGDALLVPWWTNGGEGVVRSTDAGATWSEVEMPAGSLAMRPRVGFVALADGRAAWLGAEADGNAAQRAVYWITEDGTSFSGPVALRSPGGAWQQPLAGVGLPNGDLAVELLDDQSVWGGFSSLRFYNLPSVVQVVTP